MGKKKKKKVEQRKKKLCLFLFGAELARLCLLGLQKAILLHCGTTKELKTLLYQEDSPDIQRIKEHMLLYGYIPKLSISNLIYDAKRPQGTLRESQKTQKKAAYT